MRIKIVLLILMCAVACSDKPTTVVLPVSFHDKVAFQISDWKVTQDRGGKIFTAKGIGSVRELSYWGEWTNYHKFSCSWGTNTSGENSGNILIKYVYHEDTTVTFERTQFSRLFGIMDSSIVVDSATVTVSEKRSVERRKTIVDSDLGKHSVYRPIIEALAKSYP